MTNKKELNEEQLSKASGGAIYSSNCGIEYEDRKLGQYETENYIGREVVIISENQFIACGTLLASYEKSWGCGTRRYIKLQLRPNYDHETGNENEFCVDDHSTLEAHLVIKYDK